MSPAAEVVVTGAGRGERISDASLPERARMELAELVQEAKPQERTPLLAGLTLHLANLGYVGKVRLEGAGRTLEEVEAIRAWVAERRAEEAQQDEAAPSTQPEAQGAPKAPPELPRPTPPERRQTPPSMPTPRKPPSVALSSVPSVTASVTGQVWKPLGSARLAK